MPRAARVKTARPPNTPTGWILEFWDFNGIRHHSLSAVPISWNQMKIRVGAVHWLKGGDLSGWGMKNSEPSGGSNIFHISIRCGPAPEQININICT